MQNFQTNKYYPPEYVDLRTASPENRFFAIRNFFGSFATNHTGDQLLRNGVLLDLSEWLAFHYARIDALDVSPDHPDWDDLHGDVSNNTYEIRLKHDDTGETRFLKVTGIPALILREFGLEDKEGNVLPILPGYGSLQVVQ